ncbi:MAG: gliding motility-associated C-terminal domain-containing protein [Saprospiraceae bacterium]
MLLAFLVLQLPARGQVCECLNCPQPLPPPGPDSCQTLEFVLNVKGALNDDLSNPFQGICGLQVNFQHNYVWSLSMCLVSPGGDTLEFIGPNLISGFASSALSVWDVTFVQSSIFPNPDPGFSGKWSNDQLWEAFQVFSGTYHPSGGDLEDFDSGPVNGQWKILVKNCTELEKGTFLNFSLVFCDDAGIDCSCQAFAGKLNETQPQFRCQGDPDLALDLEPVFFGPEPDTSLYDYLYIESESGVVNAYLKDVDLTMADPGWYTLCGLSVLKEDIDSLPMPDGMLTVSNLFDLLFSDAPPFCGDITSQCLDIFISAPPAVRVIDTILCSGQCFPLGDSLYCQTTSISDTIRLFSGCDSIVNLNLQVLAPQVVSITDTLCNGEFFIVGNNFYSKTGSYIDTLNSIFTGCDSIVQLDLFVVDIDAQATVQGVLGCAVPTVGISGIGSQFNVVDPSFLWTAGPGGQVVGGQGTLFALVNEPAAYTLRISKQLESGKVCTDSVQVTVQENPLKPDLKGPAVVSYCEGSTVNLTQLGFADQNNLGGSIAYYDTFPFIPIHQIGPVVDPTTLDTVYVWYQAGGCLDTLAMTWKEVPKPQATILPAINICNNDAGGVFNTLINFDTLVSGANVIGSWANTDNAPVGGVFPVLDFNGVPGPASYTFTWTSLNAAMPCANISRTIEIFVENCSCPSIAVLPPGPFCTSEAGVDLTDYVLTMEPGFWSLINLPSGTNPASIQGDSLVVQNRDTGTYTLTFHLTDLPPPGCPDTASFDLDLFAPPVLSLQPTDTLCNDSTGGIWPTSIDLDGLILSGPSGGQWTDVNGSGAGGVLPLIQMQGVPPGNYSFAYTTNAASLPCPEATASAEITVLNCICPPIQVMAEDTICTDGPVVLLADYAISSSSAVWSVAQTPGGSNPAVIQNGLLLVSGADTGQYQLILTLDPPAPANCPQDDTLFLLIASPPAAVVQPRDTLCNADLPGSYPFDLSATDLILSGDTSGTWSFNSPIPGVTGILPDLQFIGVTPGAYGLTYSTNTAIFPCLDHSYTTQLVIVDCSCPSIADTAFCNTVPSFDLDQLHLSSLTVTWEIVTFPPGGQPGVLAGSTLNTLNANPGTYYIKGTFDLGSGSPCQEEWIVEVTLVEQPSISMRDSVTVCNVLGPAGSPLIWLDSLFLLPPPAGDWLDLDNAGASGNLPSLDFYGVAPGTYRYVYQSSGANNACLAVADTLVIIVIDCSCPPLTLVPPGAFCESDTSVQLDAYKLFSDAGTWNLTAAPAGSNPAVLTGANLNLSGADPGMYRFLFTLAAPPPPNCPDTAGLSLTLVPSPSAGQFADSVTICAGSPVALDLSALLAGQDPAGSWLADNLNPGPIDGLDVQSGMWNGLVPVLSGEYRIYYVVAGTGPCPADSASLVVSILHTPEAEAGPDRIIGCDEDEVILGTPPMPGQTHTIYSWSLGSGPIAMTPAVSVDAIGTYVLQAIDTVTGCLATDTVVVTAGQPGPVAMGLEMTAPECLSDNGTIEIISVQGGVPPYLYQIGQNGFSGDPIFSGLGEGTWLVTVQDAQGCLADSLVTLVSPNSFSVDLGPDQIVAPGTVVNLEAQLVNHSGVISEVTWEPFQISCPNCLTQQFIADQDVIVRVLVVNTNGCEASDEVLIQIREGQARFFVPSAFSPNRDGINDAFTIYGNDWLALIEKLDLFDRWGNHLATFSDLPPGDVQVGWDGTSKGQLLDPGVYIYTAELLLLDGQKRLLKGEVNLLR